ncbi:flagellar basal body protein FliL [Clostridiaceae bacterium 14S0207]|nr:flagellar basal body protein FliL [Clostridiaceae bacterium 14S0207]
MAKNKMKKVANANGSVATEASGNNGNLFKIIIIILLVLLLLGGAIFAGFMYANSKNPISKNINTNFRNNFIKDLVICPLDENTINLADKDAKRYIKVKVSLGYEKNAKLAAELEKDKDKVTDCVISVIRCKKADDLNAAHEEDVKKTIKDKVNQILINGQIEQVYFSEILIQ